MKLRFLLAFLVVLHQGALVFAADAFTPDPLSVRWQGTGYRYPQNGWAVLHIEGEPYDRGYQHGWLMAKEIENYIAALSEHRATNSPTEYWDLYRQLVGSLYLNRFDREYREEMKGIAEGAAAAGARASGKPIDLVDIAGVNLWIELACLDDALRATPSGVEGVRASKPIAAYPPPNQEHHCSAFAATGPATADGKIVFGHITMWNIHQASHFFVWLDVKPTKGHRVVMQTFPGGIYSGMDYYISSSGLMLTETTIDQTRFNPEGTPLATRARRALQYANTIDELVKELSVRNNGLYTNEWLLGDANTNEIAVFEQGTNATRLRRSSKNEWLSPGVEGFYWGCNNGKDLQVRLDTYASLDGQPADVSWRPSDRDLAWLKLYREHRGKIDVAFGKLAYSGPPLAKIRSLDAKVTTSALAKNLTAHALCGPPYGRIWEPEPWQKDKWHILCSLVPNEWTLVSPTVPVRSEMVAVDLGGKEPPFTRSQPPTAPAWHGTLLPETDADVWLTAGFARCERLVALEHALAKRSGGKLTTADREELAVAIFGQQSDYHAARAARPSWRNSPGGAAPSPLDQELDRARWHKEQASYGALTLYALRAFMGEAAFDLVLDGFGKSHAGKPVTATQFVSEVGRTIGKPMDAWLADWEKKPKIGGSVFSIASWLDEPESALIVYGTQGDASANREAAVALQQAVRVGFGNVIVPVITDLDVNEENLRSAHVVLVGRPSTNKTAKQFAGSLPVTFGPGSVHVGHDHYAHEGTALVAATTNPLAARYSVVLLGGLSADATYRACSRAQFPEVEVMVVYANGKTRQVALSTRGSTDDDKAKKRNHP
jgi:hypothetical protein